MTNGAKTILGLLAVGAAGVAVGMLLAPSKGTDTRESIKDTFTDLSDKLTDFISDGKEKIAGVISQGKEKFSDVAGDIASHGKEIKKEVKSGLDHSKQALS